jgi:putative hydrolase
VSDPADPANPFGELLGDLLKLIGAAQGSGAAPWFDSARALAHSVATDNAPEPNADPLVRIRLEELARVAELHVSAVTGRSVGSGDHPLTYSAVSRGTWAAKTLEAWQPYIRRMVAAQEAMTENPMSGLAGLSALGELDVGAEGDAGAGIQELLGRFAATMGPAILGLQFGSAAGHLAHHALGQYALPIPWPEGGELVLVPDNIAAFAESWSLPLDETQLWVCVRELTAHSVLTLPHVAGRLRELLEASTVDAVAAQRGLAEQLGASADPDLFRQLMSDPESVFADLLTPSEHPSSAQLTAVTTAFGGYVDHVTGAIATGLTGSASALREAWHRHRASESRGEQVAAGLFGLDLGAGEVDRGAAFVRGVLERAGEEGLARLWTSAKTLPTPAEVDAPGLWLERIDLPDES